VPTFEPVDRKEEKMPREMIVRYTCDKCGKAEELKPFQYSMIFGSGYDFPDKTPKGWQGWKEFWLCPKCDEGLKEYLGIIKPDQGSYMPPDSSRH